VGIMCTRDGEKVITTENEKRKEQVVRMLIPKKSRHRARSGVHEKLRKERKRRRYAQ